MRYRDTGGRMDEQSQGAGDGQWRGVWAQGDIDKIPEGYAADAQNMTFLEGSPRTRLGSYVPAAFQHDEFVGPLFGSGIFSDPNGKEWLLIAAAGAIWRMRDGHTPRQIEIPETIESRVEFVQAFDRVLLFRGEDKTPWSWDGIPAHAFAPISQAEDTEDGTDPIPNGPDLARRPGLKPAIVGQRLYVPHDRTGLAASDVLDYTRYDEAFQDFNLAGPSDDQAIGLLPFANGLIVANDQSMQLVSGLTGTLIGARIDPVSSSTGCVAGGTLVQVGADAMFLSHTGVYRVTQVVESRLAAAAQAVSRPIERYIERINFKEAAGAVAAFHGRYYWLAVPMDGASVNNRLLRYDTVSEAWQGIDRYTRWNGDVQIDALHKTDFQGERRLYAIDYAAAMVHLLEYGRYDIATGAGESTDPLETHTHRSIAARLQTRGYTLKENQDKRFVRGLVQVKGWAGNYRVDAIGAGVNEEQALVSQTAPSRTRYDIFGQAAYDPSNADDNHAEPDRQDYSVDFGTDWSPEENGVDLDLEQVRAEPFTIRRHGRHLQLEITNTAGTLAIVSVQLDGDPGRRALRPRGS